MINYVTCVKYKHQAAIITKYVSETKLIYFKDFYLVVKYENLYRRQHFYEFKTMLPGPFVHAVMQLSLFFTEVQVCFSSDNKHYVQGNFKI